MTAVEDMTVKGMALILKFAYPDPEDIPKLSQYLFDKAQALNSESHIPTTVALSRQHGYHVSGTAKSYRHNGSDS